MMNKNLRVNSAKKYLEFPTILDPEENDVSKHDHVFNVTREKKQKEKEEKDFLFFSSWK